MNMVTADWRPTKLDELGSVGRGKSRHRPRNASFLYGGLYPFFQTGDIKAANFYLTEYSQTYSDEGLAQSKLWKPGTLCITIAANIAESAILGIEGCFPDSVVGFVADPDKADVRFIKYYMEILKLQMQNVSHGATQDNLSVDKLLSFDFLVPPLPIQQRIASILSAYDELIENSQRRIKILEDMARGLYREWFVQLRFPGHENHPRVASALGEIPNGWTPKALGDVCSRITDGSHFSPASVEDGYPMASVKDMHDWGIDLDSCRRISSADYADLVRNDCKPLKDDVLIAKDGSYLKHTFVVGDEQDLVILSSIAMLRPNDSIRPNFLSFALRDPVTKERMKGIVSGVAIPRIVLKDFRRFEILVPPLETQIDWAKRIDPMVVMCRKLILQVENLRRTRDLLLPRLLSGQIEVEVI